MASEPVEDRTKAPRRRPPADTEEEQGDGRKKMSGQGRLQGIDDCAEGQPA